VAVDPVLVVVVDPALILVEQLETVCSTARSALTRSNTETPYTP